MKKRAAVTPRHGLYFTENRAKVPVTVGVAFSMLTYLNFVFGIWEFPFRHDLRLAAGVLLLNVAMIVGFVVGVRKVPSRTPTLERRRRAIGRQATRLLVDRVFRVALIVTLATFVPRLIIAGQLYDLQTMAFLEKVQTGWEDAYAVYKMNQYDGPPGLWKYVNYACVATAFIAWLYTPLAILLWKRLSTVVKIFTFIFWMCVALSAVIQGRNFGIFDLVVQILVAYLVRSRIVEAGARESPVKRGVDMTAPNSGINARNTQAMRRRQIRGGRRIRPLIATAVGLVALGLYFANTMRSRVSDQYADALPLGSYWVGIDNSHPAWLACPELFRPFFATFSQYVSHGYVGLAMGMDTPFESTMGLGGSHLLISNAQQMFGIDLLPLTYQYKIFLDTGYDPYITWHTAYLWLANDVSMLGVPFVLFVLMFVFGSCWRDFLHSGNLFAFLQMSCMGTFFVFISANNQIAGSFRTLFAFWVLLLAWLLTRDRYEWKGAYLPTGTAAHTSERRNRNATLERSLL